MAIDGLGKVNGNFKVTPPQVKQWQGPDGSYGMSWNMSWEYSASAQSQNSSNTDAVAAGGPDTTSLPSAGLSSAMSLDGSVKSLFENMQKQVSEQIATCMEQLKGVMAQLGIGAASAGGTGSVPGDPANSVPGAPGSSAPPVDSAPAGSAPPAAGGPDGSAPAAGGPEEKPRDGSRFLNIAQGIATILGGVGGMVGQIRSSGGGGGGIFGGGGGGGGLCGGGGL